MTNGTQPEDEYIFSSPENAKLWYEARMVGSFGPPISAQVDTPTSKPTPYPRWRCHGPDRDYSFAHSNIRCRVWRTTSDAWCAVVTQQRPVKRALQTFDTLGEAQAWCEEQIAEWQANT